jgi:glycosyltransferase involved in cell wall biosynthesis
MMFSLPIVATRWRGIPDAVLENKTGFLVEPKNPQAVAGCLQILLEDTTLRQRMGAAARARYESEFTINIFHQRMQAALLSAAQSAQPPPPLSQHPSPTFLHS